MKNNPSSTTMTKEEKTLEPYLIRLKANDSTLTTLDLSNNEITDLGAEKIATALEKNNTLTTLDLNHNQITDLGAEKIATALEKNNTLQLLIFIITKSQP